MAHVAVGIVEPDDAAAERLAAFLGEHGCAVERHGDGDALLACLAVRPPQLLLLGAGAREQAALLALVRRVRARSRLPAVVLAAGGADDIGQVALLEAGADDVVPRALPPRALLARLRAVLRRAEWGLAAEPGGAAPRVVAANGWRLVPDRRQLLRPDGTECALTTAEFDLMHLLLEQRGRAVSRDAAAAAVFRRPFRAEDRTVDNLVLRLRRKLGDAEGRAIKTVRGAGYMFVGFREEEDLRVA